MATGNSKTVKKTFRPLVHFNFFRLHLLYFVLVIFISAAILNGSNTSPFHIGYTDALLLSASAMCNAGLTPVNLSSLNGFQQSVLFVLMLLGDITFVSISVVVVRRHFFAKRMSELVDESDTARRVAENIEEHADGGDVQESSSNDRRRKWISSRERSASETNDGEREPLKPRGRNDDLIGSHVTGYGSFPAPWDIRPVKFLVSGFNQTRSSRRKHHYLSFQPELDHKGRFVSLDEQQRTELGGVEYRALKLLTWLLPLYTFGWLAVIIIALVPYSTFAIPQHIRSAQEQITDPTWWGFFASMSGYTNSGLNLLNSNMIPLRGDYFILVFTGVAILAGNVLYPVFLRLSIWSLSQVVPKHSEIHHSLSFLLQHPRRCFLLLFPSKQTWYLLGIQLAITLTTWIFWMLLSIDQPEINPGLPAGQRTMDGVYQALCLRACGFYIIEMRDLAPSLQFLFLIVMYISAYPIIMSLRQTNVYEERSLGQDDQSKYTVDNNGRSTQSRSQLSVHIRKQLAYDVYWLILAIFLICIVEHHRLRTFAAGFSIFAIMFETVSAYGNIGLSLSVPYDSYSFCGAWHTTSKLVLVMMMLLGRHRILPMAIDRAVLLPGQELMDKLDKDLSSMNDERREEFEHRIRDDERGAQAEIPGASGQQDPEHDQQ